MIDQQKQEIYLDYWSVNWKGEYVDQMVLLFQDQSFWLVNQIR